jgi:hypothetical protein
MQQVLSQRMRPAGHPSPVIFHPVSTSSNAVAHCGPGTRSSAVTGLVVLMSQPERFTRHTSNSIAGQHVNSMEYRPGSSRRVYHGRVSAANFHDTKKGHHTQHGVPV